MKRKMAVDLDDVLMDFNTGLCNFHNARYGTNLKRDDITQYFLKDTWGCSREEEIRRIMEFYTSSEHDEALPVPGAVEGIKRLQDDWDMYIVTARPRSMGEKTFSWLTRHFPALADSVHFTCDVFDVKEEAKGEICKQLGVSVFIDDAPHNIENTAPVVEQVFLFDTPWNRSHALTHVNAERVRSWDEICTLLATKY